jgi:ABC-2 type transport system ATP-binding protein
MAEAEEMSDRVAILLNHKLAAIGTPMEITATGASLTKVSVRSKDSCLSDPSITFPAVQQRLNKDGYEIMYSTDIGLTVSAVISQVQTSGDTLIDLRVERPSLEDRFLEITNQRNASNGGSQ